MERRRNLNILFNHTTGKLMSVSKHTTSQQENHVIVVIRGKRYLVSCSEKFLIYNISINFVPDYFRNDIPYVVRLTNYSEDEMHCLICFHDIPEIPQLDIFGQPSSLPPMAFSVCVFEKGKFMDVRFTTKSDGNSPNFALGCFNAKSFMDEIRKMYWRDRRTPILWKIFFSALYRIGYFDIYDYNHFRSLVLRYFRRIFSFPEYKPEFKRKMFFLFVERLLAKNSWFLIVGGFIQCVQCPPRSLIDLFSDNRNPPTVNFIDPASGLVGVSMYSGNGYDFKMNYKLVSLKTLEVSDIGNSSTTSFYVNQNPVSEAMMSDLFKYFGNSDDDDDDSSPPPLLRRRPASVDTPAIKQGLTTFGNNCLIVFKRRNEITVFIKRKDGTFEPFNISLFILSKIFKDNGELDQLTEHFTHFPFIPTIDLIEGLRRCGFQPIFYGTATIEQIRVFLLDSDFGQVLQELRQEFAFPRRLDSIRENRFIMDFNVIFRFLLEKMRNRYDLTPEIIEILRFLELMVEFLTVPPDSE